MGIKKRNVYGTVICDGVTHKPIALLDGRDGTELIKWLEENKHIKIITRDRAGAYASAISKTLPEVIQIADRFHLFNNFMEAIKQALNSKLPEKINISEEPDKIDIEDEKKSEYTTEKELTDYQNQLREFIIQVQSLNKDGYTKSQIVKMLNTTYKRIRKFINGDPEELCRSDGRNTNSRTSLVDPYKERINILLSEGYNYKETYKQIKSEGYAGKYTILCDYCTTLNFKSLKARTKVVIKKRFVNRSGVFKYLWSDKKEIVSDEAFEKIVLKYPIVNEIKESIIDFRKIFKDKDLFLLDNFINKYIKSHISSLIGFIGGLLKDKEAVENSVVFKYSNGFVEGNINRLKTIKRQMYGRANLSLLKARVIMSNGDSFFVFCSTIFAEEPG